MVTPVAEMTGQGSTPPRGGTRTGASSPICASFERQEAGRNKEVQASG
jgi:hypothetical protein